MMEMQQCLICGLPLEDAQVRYHPLCCRKLFGQPVAPELPYAYDELKEAAKKIVRSRITVPGVQAKLSLHLEKSRERNSRFTLVGLWGDFILKPPHTAYPHIVEVEHLTMHLAGLFKIETVPFGMIPLKSGELAFITRRIDRLPNGIKLHMEDMCQLCERLTEDKYRGSMEQIGKTIKRFSSNPLLDCIRFYEMVLFSFLTGNADMHLKNFSLIYPVDGMIKLSAAYDMLATRLLISEKDDPEETALTINGKKSKVGLNDFRRFAENLGLNEKQITNIFRRFQKMLAKAMPVIEKSFLPPGMIAEFKQLILDRAARLGWIIWERKQPE